MKNDRSPIEYGKLACDALMHRFDAGCTVEKIPAPEGDAEEPLKALIFDSLYEHRTYKIFAVFKTTAKSGQGFAYHTFIDAAHQEEFDSFISRVKELSLYDTGITPTYGDHLLTLSTCEYSVENGRLVVVAVKEK